MRALRALRLEPLLEGADDHVRPRLFLPTVVAVALAFAAVVLPSAHEMWWEVGVAAGIAAAIVAGSTLDRRSPRASLLAVPLGYVAMIAFLRDGLGGNSSGFAGLLLLPIIWYALVGTVADVLVGVAALAAAYIVPLVALGGPAYPASGWRGAAILLVVSLFAGLTVQALVTAGRRRAAEAVHRAEALEQVRRALEEQNEQLEHLTRTKDEFLALVSHELRTPLTSIIGYVEMAREDDLSDESGAFLDIASRNADRLAKLVDDLLFVARLDKTPLRLSRTTVGLAGLLAEAIEAAKPAAESKRIMLELEAAQDLPAVTADPLRIAQVVDNLVSNAVKFTPDGGRVLVSARNDGAVVVVAVADTGMGIPAAEQRELFTRFFRTSTSTGAQIPGTGLGLWISQEIARAHGTRIDVVSTPGEGTTFTFALPTADVPAPA